MVYKTKTGSRRTQQRQQLDNQQQEQEQDVQHQGNTPNASVSQHRQNQRPPMQQASSTFSQLSTSSVSSFSSSTSGRHRGSPRRNNGNIPTHANQADLRAHSSFHNALDALTSPSHLQHTASSDGRLMRSQTFYQPSSHGRASSKHSRLQIKNLEHVYDANEQRIQHLERMVDQLNSELRRHDLLSNDSNTNGDTSNQHRNKTGVSPKTKKGNAKGNKKTH